MTEGGKSDDDPFAGGGGDEQEFIVKELKKKFGKKIDCVKTWDGEDMDISNSDAPVYKQIADQTENTKEEEQAYMYSNMMGQGDEDSVHVDTLTEEQKDILRKAGYAGDFPPGSSIKPKGDEEDWAKDKKDAYNKKYEADRGLLYLMSYPGDIPYIDYENLDKNEPHIEAAIEHYGKDKIELLKNSKAGKSAKAYNRVRDRNMRKKIKEVESDSNTVAIVAPGAGLSLIHI